MARATSRTTCIDEANSVAVPHGIVRETVVTFPARDGYPLTGTWYETGDPAPDIVVFNAGGGVSSDRYRHFLRYLAAHGVPALAYDYRGVGRSAPARRRGFDAPRQMERSQLVWRF